MECLMIPKQNTLCRTTKCPGKGMSVLAERPRHALSYYIIQSRYSAVWGEMSTTNQVHQTSPKTSLYHRGLLPLLSQKKQ